MHDDCNNVVSRKRILDGRSCASAASSDDIRRTRFYMRHVHRHIMQCGVHMYRPSIRHMRWSLLSEGLWHAMYSQLRLFVGLLRERTLHIPRHRHQDDRRALRDVHGVRER